MLLSSGNAQLGLLCYVPASKLDKCNASEWMKAVLKCVQKQKTRSGKGAKGGRFKLRDVRLIRRL